MTPLALIVDDEPDIRELLELTLSRMGIDCQAAADLGEAYQLLSEHQFNLCLTDMQLPDGKGIDLVRHIQQQYSELPVAVITAYGNMQTAIESLKAGAFDFLAKPVDLDKLRNIISSALRLEDQAAFREQGATEALLGESASMQRVRSLIYKLSRSQASVFISGESGTGKELVARLIHRHSPRRDQPFIAVNCGAIPSELMESEFFGHKKGSFTGATQNKQGLFQAADGGTLFLDEVADLPLAMQVKLLRAIQEGAVRPIGEQTEKAIDVRILSATNKDLMALTGEEKFRSDLYFRLNVIELSLPPLRERPEDIGILADYILKTRIKQQGKAIPRLAGKALQTLTAYPFPGNIRELENILARTVALNDSDIIEASQLHLPGLSNPNNPIAINEQAGVKSSSLPAREDMPLEDYLAGIERQEITTALEKTRWNRAKAARLLKLSPRQLRYRMAKLELSD